MFAVAQRAAYTVTIGVVFSWMLGHHSIVVRLQFSSLGDVINTATPLTVVNHVLPLKTLRFLPVSSAY